LFLLAALPSSLLPLGGKEDNDEILMKKSLATIVTYMNVPIITKRMKEKRKKY